MIFRKSKDKDVVIRQDIKDLGAKIDKALTVYKDTSLSEREFNLLAEKSDLQNELINSKTQIIKLKDEVKIKDKTIEDKSKELDEYKEKVKNLSYDYSKMMDYKAKYEEQKKENNKLQKQLDKLNEEGITLPQKVKGSTMPRKGQALKETVRPVKS